MSTKIIIVDDHPITRGGIRALFEHDDQVQVVGEAGEGKTAIKLVKRTKARYCNNGCFHARNDWN